MCAESERGEGKLGSVIGLAFLVAVLWAAWNVIPVYFANYSLDDRLVELARLPKYNNTDDDIMRQIVKSAAEYRIEEYVNAKTCRIATQEHRRTIACDYTREVQILPGWNYKFHFTPMAEQPLL